MNKIFQRHIEDFTCESCGHTVVGNGYTNHCPKCLTSKHVDVHPGDRKASCGGLMPAIAIEQDAGQSVLLQRCVRCAHERRQRSVAEDDFDALVAVARRAAQG